MQPDRRPGLIRCRECGFVTADVAIDEADLRALYGRHYFNGGEYADYAADQDVLRRNFSRRIATLLRHVSNPGARSLFEIGSAYGFFLDEAKPRFATVSGIDVAEDAARAAQARGLSVQAGDFLTTDTGRHDVYCLWDTIEHLQHPDRVIAKIAREIRAGGIIAITTGDIDSFNARLRGRRWRLIHPPTHLHYFSGETLAALLARHGFRTVEREYVGSTRSLRAIAHGLLALGGRSDAVYRSIEPLIPPRWEVTLNLFDIMHVIARKM